jgi:hypothetical protein
LTSLPMLELLGSQQPRLSNVPPFGLTTGPAACHLAELAGRVLDPWQRNALDAILGEKPDGSGLWAARTAVLVVTRQNGKGVVIEAWELAKLFILKSRLVTHTAHEYKTAAEAFRRMRELFDNCPALSKHLMPDRSGGIRTANGEQGFTLKSGARLVYLARSKSSGRGFDGDDIVLDEAQELSDDEMAALVPTLITRPNPQVLMTGTAPSLEAEVLPRMMATGRSGTDPSMCYLEWSAQEPDDPTAAVDLDDRRLWAQANPGYGIRIGDEGIAGERSLMDDEKFARERLGIIGGGRSAAVIGADVWAQLAALGQEPVDPVALAVDVSPERHSSIAAAWVRVDGGMSVELIDSRPGTGWVVERLAQLKGQWSPVAVGLDPAAPAGSLAADLTAAGVDFVAVSGREMAQACGSFLDVVKAGTLRHNAAPVLAAAVDAGRKRETGDVWHWQRRDATDISPLVAVTIAAHARRVHGAAKKSYASAIW